MRILYVTAAFPYPLTSGYLRHYHLIRALAAAGHQVTLAAIVPAPPAHEDRRHVEGIARVVLARPSRGRWRRRLERLLEAVAGTPARDAARLRNAVAHRIERDGEFDVVVLTGKRTVPVLDAIDRIPLVADLCDATSERLAAMLADARGVRRARLVLELRAVTRAERRLARRASRLLAASDRDARALAERLQVPIERIAVMPNGVDTGYWRRGREALGRDQVVFTGVMSYEPNADAAALLVREIMPLVRERLPEARCSIVGRDPTPELRALGETRGVCVTGFVEDLRPFLEEASVFAAPLRYGAGIQNKLLEAMAMELPSVVSPLVAGGLVRDAAAPPVAVAADPRAFAQAIVDRLEAARRDPAPDHGARRFVQAHFSWERSGELLLATIASVAGEQREARA